MSAMDAKTIAVTLEELQPLLEEALAAGKSVKFSPRGISMLPMLRPELDSVVLSPLPERLQKYDLILYRTDEGKYVLHRIVEAGDLYACMGDNRFQKEVGIRRDQMVGVVTSYYRGAKRRSVTALPHRLYCRLWHYSRPLRRFWRRVLRRLRK